MNKDSGMKGREGILVQRNSKNRLIETCNSKTRLGIGKSSCVAGRNIMCKTATGNEAKEIGRSRPWGALCGVFKNLNFILTTKRSRILSREMAWSALLFEKMCSGSKRKSGLFGDGLASLGAVRVLWGETMSACGMHRRGEEGLRPAGLGQPRRTSRQPAPKPLTYCCRYSPGE